jgi:hypothetical protein
MIPGALFVPAQHLQVAAFNRRFDRLAINLIEIYNHFAFEIRLLPKRHIHKTESVVVHAF